MHRLGASATAAQTPHPQHRLPSLLLRVHKVLSSPSSPQLPASGRARCFCSRAQGPAHWLPGTGGRGVRGSRPVPGLALFSPCLPDRLRSAKTHTEATQCLARMVRSSFWKPILQLEWANPKSVLGLSLDVCTDPESHGTLSETTPVLASNLCDLSLCGGGL